MSAHNVDGDITFVLSVKCRVLGVLHVDPVTEAGSIVGSGCDFRLFEDRHLAYLKGFPISYDSIIGRVIERI